MKKILVLSAIVLLAGCGGSKIQLKNGTGMDIETVTLTIAENTETWQNIGVDKTFGSDMAFPQAATVILLQWEANGQQWDIEYASIDSASLAERVSILFASDEMSVNYTF
ncbi:MAG: hypothetical protein KAH54_03305 [Candidatus Sabulitectum sp.]|nr:hypothetical protein [Candidatus Sabulitectum sp.]